MKKYSEDPLATTALVTEGSAQRGLGPRGQPLVIARFTFRGSRLAGTTWLFSSNLAGTKYLKSRRSGLPARVHAEAIHLLPIAPYSVGPGVCGMRYYVAAVEGRAALLQLHSTGWVPPRKASHSN
eukprot:s789_g9.t2